MYFFLIIKQNFIELFEKNPLQLIKNYYTKWFQDFGDNSFEDFIINKILTPIEENFELDLE